MRAVIQRVKLGSVSIEGREKDPIGNGLVVLLGVARDDNEKDIKYLARKIANMRIFSDENGKMNLSVMDIDGDVLIVSQFTLFANTKKGNRPYFDAPAKSETATPIYKKFVQTISEYIGKTVVTGEFGASMLVEILNDGPVTIILDSKDL